MGRPIALASLAALLCGMALALSACGGSEDSTSTASTAASTAESNPKGNGSGESDRGGGSGSKTADGGGSGSTSKGSSVTPLKVSGGGSDQFRVKGGGDNSVQEFGDEGDEGQLSEAAETVHDFYARRATGDWAGACALLSKSLRRRLEQLAKTTPQAHGADCPSFLAFSTADLSPAEWRQITTVDAGSLRYEGEQAFLIYYGPEHTVYAMPMIGEDGTWKVNALTSAALPGA
jgi:hypothetical protein